MSFTTPNGTRGGDQPSVASIGEMNAANLERLHKGESVGNLLVLISIGKKSGELRESPVMYFEGTDGSLLIVASAAGGPRHPSWYFNLGAHPDRVRIIHQGRETPVAVEELQGDDREREWGAIKNVMANFAKYEEMTDRQIPVIRVTPTSA